MWQYSSIGGAKPTLSSSNFQGSLCVFPRPCLPLLPGAQPPLNSSALVSNEFARASRGGLGSQTLHGGLGCVLLTCFARPVSLALLAPFSLALLAPLSLASLAPFSLAPPSPPPDPCEWRSPAPARGQFQVHAGVVHAAVRFIRPQPPPHSPLMLLASGPTSSSAVQCSA